MICPVCLEEIKNYDYKMIAIERPYVNIYLHKGKCYETFYKCLDVMTEKDVLNFRRINKGEKLNDEDKRLISSICK